jgi:hemerythrin
MPLTWTASLSVGVNEIDNQHKELFNKINSLLDAMSKGKGRDEIEKVIQFLSDYVVMHFNTEEKMMTIHKYPEMASHKGQHNSFTMKLQDLKKKLAAEGPTSTVVIEAQPLLVDWWYNHINKVDKVLGEFLKRKV